VVLFLTVFVLIGINPALQKVAARLRQLLDSATQRKDPAATRMENVHAELFANQYSSRQLNDFEIFVIRRLAQASDKALSRKQLNETLHLSPGILNKTLKSLHRRKLIKVKMSTLLGPRFALSETGRRYALEEGYIIEVHERKGALG
jgi:DNA-binding MarR family transcriptional regulator